MWSQSATAFVAAALLVGCGSPPTASVEVSDPSPPSDSPDLLLHEVAFARLAEGRVTARGTATQLGYRRAGGRLGAQSPTARLHPQPATGYAVFGEAQPAGPHGGGERATNHGTAAGGTVREPQNEDPLIALAVTALIAASPVAQGPLDFTAQTMRMEPRGGRTLLDGAVRLSRGGMVVTGDRAVVEFVSDQGSRRAPQKARRGDSA